MVITFADLQWFISLLPSNHHGKQCWRSTYRPMFITFSTLRKLWYRVNGNNNIGKFRSSSKQNQLISIVFTIIELQGWRRKSGGKCLAHHPESDPFPLLITSSQAKQSYTRYSFCWCCLFFPVCLLCAFVSTFINSFFQMSSQRYQRTQKMQRCSTLIVEIWRLANSTVHQWRLMQKHSNLRAVRSIIWRQSLASYEKALSVTTTKRKMFMESHAEFIWLWPANTPMATPTRWHCCYRYFSECSVWIAFISAIRPLVCSNFAP